MGEGLEQTIGVEPRFSPERVTPSPAPDPAAGVPWTLLRMSADDCAKLRLMTLMAESEGREEAGWRVQEEKGGRRGEECRGGEEEEDASEQSANWGAPTRLTRAHERIGGNSVIIGIGAADGRGVKAAESERGGGGLNEWATALSVPSAGGRRVTVTSEEVVERELRREVLGGERETRGAVEGGDRGGGSSELRADGGEGEPVRREWRELQSEKARRVIRLAELQPVGLPSGS